MLFLFFPFLFSGGAKRARREREREGDIKIKGMLCLDGGIARVANVGERRSVGGSVEEGPTNIHEEVGGSEAKRSGDLAR